MSKFGRITTVVVFVISSLLAVTPSAEASPVIEYSKELADEPRHIQTVKSVNVYRLTMPSIQSISSSITTAPPVRSALVSDAVPPASGIVETVIAFAMAQLGDIYVWGADGPNAWDCSGLVRAAFAHAGITTTRTTRTLINEGSSVSRANMLRGDLVFPASGHVGIYLGPETDTFIHAPQSGDVVKISPVYDFYAARRIA